MRPVRIAITGIHGGAQPQAGLGAASALRLGSRRGAGRGTPGDAGTGGIVLLGLAEDPLDSGAYDDGLFDEVLLAAPADPERLAEGMEELTRRCAVDLLIPGRVSHAEAAYRARERLAACGIRVLVADPRDFAAEVPGLGGAAAGLAKPGFQGGEQFEVAVVSDARGLPRIAMAVRRLDDGWLYLSVDDEALRACGERVAARLANRGPATFRFVRQASRIVLAGRAPTLPAWSRLAVEAGCDLAGGLVDLALGRPPRGETATEPGLLYVRRAVDRPVSLRRLARLTLSRDVLQEGGMVLESRP